MVFFRNWNLFGIRQIINGEIVNISNETRMSNIRLLLWFDGLFKEFMSKTYKSPAELIELLPIICSLSVGAILKSVLEDVWKW